MSTKKLDIIKKTYVGILAVIFGGIVLHAPLTVALGTLWPNYYLLAKSWKEILMLFAGLTALYLMYKSGQMKKIFHDPIIIAIAAYALLHLFLLFFMNQGLSAGIAGLAIDLRYVLYFALVYIAITMYPGYRKLFIKIGIGGALTVLVFALLQVFVLPYDVLKYIGYDKHTIIPYLLVDRNFAFIRINSTLRGPNPLGAYAAMILVLLAAAVAKKKIAKNKRALTIAIILAVGSLVALWSSYSRSAQIGAIFSMGILLAVVFWSKLSKKIWIYAGIAAILICGGLYMARDTNFVSNVLMHQNPTAVKIKGSNEGHVNSINSAFNQLLHQPIGAGIGSTGSASLLGKNSEIIENQYLLVAHEVGWLGLLLFISIFVMVMARLWSLRKDWLALGVFASGVGLAIIGIFLPVWTDDTVSIIWWGLAAVVVGSRLYIVDGRGDKKHGE
ncbi:MAG: O-antigen ligase family protein [Candidatus Saccharibacteria bacterium]|nr:O-antigen ligase family protein [Candidatus Saccharibacteria bacterium]